MATAFQFQDLDLLGPNKKASSSSPTPSSIVSLASEMFSNTGGFVTDPEQFMPTSMSDLFEGALCDDEIPSLLNLDPSITSDGTNSEEALQLSSDTPQEATRATSSPVVSANTANFVPISPAPSLPEPITIQQGQKRASFSQTPSPNKKLKIVAITTTTGVPVYPPPTTQVLQSIQPLTALPSSDAVSGVTIRPGHLGINTSTAHIRALTGTNGAAVCLEAIEKALQESGSVIKPDCNSSSSNSSADGKQLSAEEKARQSRDRNRQHARNTRVRKKAYVEELKRTLNQLVEERDAAVHQKRLEAQGLAEQKDVRFRVIEDFLNLRGRNEADPMRWSLILEDGFRLRLPRVDIPGVVCSSGGDGNTANDNSAPFLFGTSKKILTGVKSVMEDAGMVSSLLQSLGASSLSVSYQCDHDSFMMDNTNVVLNWKATSSGAVTKGANAEFTIQGTLRAAFNPVSNKLVSMEFSF